MGEAKRRREAEKLARSADCHPGNQIPIVEPTDWQPISNKAMTMVVRLGSATLRGGIPLEAIPTLPKLKGLDDREVHPVSTGHRR